MCTPWLVAQSLGAPVGLLGWYYFSSNGVVNPFSSFRFFSNSSIGDPTLGTVVGCKTLCFCKALEGPLRRHLYQAQIQQAFLTIHNSVRVWELYLEWTRGGTVSGWPFLQSLLCTLSPYLLPWVFCSSQKNWSIHTLVFLPLELHVVCELYLGCPKLLS